MPLLSRLAIPHDRTFLRAVLLVGATLMSCDLCRAGMITYSIAVPPAPAGKEAPGGWGALVITLDKEAVFTTFTFAPFCDAPTEGFPDPASMGKTWQLGPGKYKLLPTGTLVDPEDPKEGVYGPFLVTINYEGDTAPMITSAFWQNKPTPGGERTWTFNPQKDLPAEPGQFVVVVPEPATLRLALSTVCILFAFARQKLARK